MSTSEENLYDAVCMYLLEGKYSDKETKNSKTVIRKKAKQFIIKEGLLCKLSSKGATWGIFQTVSYQAICWLLTPIHVL